MTTTHFTIDGMTCSGCVARVTKAFQRLPGVTSVNIDLPSGQASVTHDPAKSSLALFRETITAAGYKVRESA
jgi:copper chaperone CopZ